MGDCIGAEAIPFKKSVTCAGTEVEPADDVKVDGVAEPCASTLFGSPEFACPALAACPVLTDGEPVGPVICAPKDSGVEADGRTDVDCTGIFEAAPVVRIDPTVDWTGAVHAGGVDADTEPGRDPADTMATDCI